MAKFNFFFAVFTPVTHANTVAFSATISSHHVTGLGTNQPIVFDDVVTNEGSSYSGRTGIFTSQTNGTFFFLSSVMTHTGEYLEAEIVKNGAHIALMYSKDAEFEQGTNGAVVNLQQGDEVWVRHRGNTGSKVYGYGWSSFLGFKLF